MKQHRLGFTDLVITNPKNHTDSRQVRDSRIFPYYAGYSLSFATEIIKSFNLKKNSIVLDPWNGSGTTTSAAASLGFSALGQDLNPVMVLVAKARLATKGDCEVARLLLKKIINVLPHTSKGEASNKNDPLAVWLNPSAYIIIRNIEKEINNSFFETYAPLTDATNLEKIPSYIALLYVCLFRTVRRFLLEFIPSNPTWVKFPQGKKNRKRPSKNKILETLIFELNGIIENVIFDDSIKKNNEILLSSSTNISAGDKSIDLVVTSPPYCTRIDYAVATSIELATLGTREAQFDRLRRSLMGTSTVPKKGEVTNPQWGASCLDFLERLYTPPSKASQTYYYKNHTQYFSSLFDSISELSRVLKTEAYLICVIQDSNYKDLHNDTPAIFSEMAENCGLSLLNKTEFKTSRSMAGINSKSKKYIKNKKTIESVLLFQKQENHEYRK